MQSKLNELISYLKLVEHRGPEPLEGGGEIRLYRFERSASGADYDHIVVVRIMPDGSWSAYVDTGYHQPEDVASGLIKQARAIKRR